VIGDYWSRLQGKRITRRTSLKITGGAASAALLIACAGGSQSTLTFDDAASARKAGSVWFAKNDWRLADETKQAVRGGIYRGYRGDDQTGHFDAITLMSSQVPFASHVYELLMAQVRQPGVEPGSLEAGNPVGALAESWEFSADAMTVTFAMREGVKFQNLPPVNGRIMDLDDWKTSQERHLASGVYRTLISEILDKVEFPDSRHMVWKLNQPYAPLISRIHSDKFAYPIQPKELNATPSLAETISVGTGYKILDKYQPSITMEYRKHPEYWDGDPFIDRWHTPIIPEYSNQYAQFVNGNIVDFTPTARDVLLLHRDVPGTVVVANELPERADYHRFGRISPLKQAWADPRVRVAVRRSIDFKGIAEFLSNKVEFEGAGIPVELFSKTHVPQNPGYWLDPEKGELGKVSENYIYDVAEAKKLTAAAGYSDPIPLPYYIQLSAGQVPEVVQLTMDSLSLTGTFRLEVVRVPTAPEYIKYRIDGQYDGFLGNPTGAIENADFHLAQEAQGTPNRAVPYPDPQIDAMVTAQRRAVSLEERWKILKDLQPILAAHMPIVPPAHEYTTFSFRWPWLHNINWGEVGSPPAGRPRWGGHLHWLSPEMPRRDSGV
jgi:ABC-type transport system substrate-binding protein